MASIASVSDSPPERHYEWQVLDLMRHIWEHGDERVDRTGVGTRSVFGAQLRFDLSDGQMPLLTTKRVYWKTATREFLWFLTGQTNIRPLCEQGVEIWTDWPLDRYRRETGDAIARADFSARIVADAAFAAQWGDLGPVYGKQWVDWPVYEPLGDGTFRRREHGVNQIADLVAGLKANPGSRRHIVEGWNVAELDAMALPPCHKTYQFHVAGGTQGKGRLNGLLYQRSCDLGLGFAFNAWSAALFIRMLAQQCDLEPGELVWMGGDVHLYLNHADLVEEQLARVPSGSPRMAILRRPASIFDYRIEDFEVTGYKPGAAISAPVAV
ncbi:thymidylate synthase [Novosphingobium lentum]|uniref:thymidylate synthase n=1 Tax=Novosphingobium lentum TaxID=145287 RepID=UPI00082C3D21|nr:thymidylate synthase [Novosphingobium lentum]